MRTKTDDVRHWREAQPDLRPAVTAIGSAVRRRPILSRPPRRDRGMRDWRGGLRHPSRARRTRPATARSDRLSKSNPGPQCRFAQSSRAKAAASSPNSVRATSMMRGPAKAFCRCRDGSECPAPFPARARAAPSSGIRRDLPARRPGRSCGRRRFRLRLHIRARPVAAGLACRIRRSLARSRTTGSWEVSNSNRYRVSTSRIFQ